MTENPGQAIARSQFLDTLVDKRNGYINPTYEGIWAYWRSVWKGVQNVQLAGIDLLGRLLAALCANEGNEEDELRGFLRVGRSTHLSDLLERCLPNVYNDPADKENNDNAHLHLRIARAIIAVSPSLTTHTATRAPKSLLTLAVEKGDVEVAGSLLENLNNETSADVRDQLSKPTTQSSKDTVLTIAVELGHLDIVKSILDLCRLHEFDVSSPPGEQGVYDTLRLLLALNPKNSSKVGETPPAGEQACQAEFVALLKCLIEYGVYLPWPKLFEGYIRDDHDLLVDVLLEHSHISDQPLFGRDSPTVKCLIIRSKEAIWDKCVRHWGSNHGEHLWDTESSQKISSEVASWVMTAVTKKRDFVIRDMLHDYPRLARERLPLETTTGSTASTDKAFLLGHIPRDSEGQIGDDKACRNIRNYVLKILVGDGTVDKIARQCGFEVHDTSLDLSGVNCRDLDDFLVALMASPKLKEQTRFEAYLMIAKFPQLPDASPHDDQHTEIHDILKWLCQSKKVQHIKELVVRDRHQHPHEWEAIHACVQNMQVEQLDWKALNLCLSNCQHDAISNWALADGIPRTRDALRLRSGESHSLQSVEHLTLYTDGDLNTLHQWYGPDGLRCLKKLKSLKINIVTDFTNQRQQERAKEFLKKKYIPGSMGFPKPRTPYSSWSGSTNSHLDDSLANANYLVSDLAHNLDQFVKTYKKLRLLPPGNSFNLVKKTKVAIVDDGIMGVSRSKTLGAQLCEQVIEGKSFAFGMNGSHHSSWFASSGESHGTQMASYISSLDPMCELYIAQVATPRIQIDSQAVAKVRSQPQITSIRHATNTEWAIEWATSKKVEIISLSLSLLYNNHSESKDLKRAVANAIEKGITVICATMDDGDNIAINDTLPARYSDVISIAACDEYGRPLRYSQKVDPNSEKSYIVQGKGLRNGRYDFTSIPETSEGSSVSTAIAAGLASLTLSCGRMAYKLLEMDSIDPTNEEKRGDIESRMRKTDPAESDWGTRLIRKKFTDMQAKDSRFIRPDMLFDAGAERGDLTPKSVKAIIKEQFRLER